MKKQMMEYIESYYKEHRDTPTRKDIIENFADSSMSTIEKTIVDLVRTGNIRHKLNRKGFVILKPYSGR